MRLLLLSLLAASWIAPAVFATESIELRSGTLHGPGDDASLATEWLAPRDLPWSGPVLVRLDRAPDAELRRELAAAGLRVEGWLGATELIAWTESAIVPQPAGVAWLAPYHPGLRIAPELTAVLNRETDDELAITLHLFSNVDPAVVADRLRSIGLEPAGGRAGAVATPRSARRQGRVDLALTRARLGARLRTLAGWPEVSWIGLRPSYGWHNDSNAWVTQSGISGGQTTPVFNAGLFGDGQIIGVFDTGVDADSCFFRDDVAGPPPTVSGFAVGTPDPSQRKLLIVDFLSSGDDPADPTDWDDLGHGTHVIGSAAGDQPTTLGARDPGDGMAPAAKLVVQDGGNAVLSCGAQPSPDCLFDNLYLVFQQAWLQGARIHSNSYGDVGGPSPTLGIYSDGSADADAFMWDHPDFLLLFAAGNAGPASGSVGSPSTAKNVVSVGAAQRAGSAGALWSNSSRGPTHDGRIKPDLVAPGVSISSALSDFDVTTDNCQTTAQSGTSMSTPTVAGLAALVREYYEKGFYPTGSGQPADGISPSAALLKATLIVSARALESVSAPPPSSGQGWGRVLLDDALYFSGDVRRTFAADVPGRFTTAGDVDVYTLSVGSSSEPLRVVLNWTDYPSTPAAATNLVNDLDLQVTSPSGALYRGNVLTAGESQTGGAHDSSNNVEVVVLDTPQAADWTVRVRSTTILQPAQGYAMVATAAGLGGTRLFAPNAVDDLSLERLGANDVRLAWGRPDSDNDHGPAESYDVYRSPAPSGAFGLRAKLFDDDPSVDWTDVGAVGAGPLFFYQVIAGNAAGVAEPLP